MTNGDELPEGPGVTYSGGPGVTYLPEGPSGPQYTYTPGTSGPVFSSFGWGASPGVALRTPSANPIKDLAREKGLQTITRNGKTYLVGQKGREYARKQGLPYMSAIGEVEKYVGDKKYLLRGQNFTPEVTFRVPREVFGKAKEQDPSAILMRDKFGTEFIVTKNEKLAENLSKEGYKSRFQRFGIGESQTKDFNPAILGLSEKESQTRFIKDSLKENQYVYNDATVNYIKKQLDKGIEKPKVVLRTIGKKTYALTPEDADLLLETKNPLESLKTSKKLFKGIEGVTLNNFLGLFSATVKQKKQWKEKEYAEDYLNTLRELESLSKFTYKVAEMDPWKRQEKMEKLRDKLEKHPGKKIFEDKGLWKGFVGRQFAEVESGAKAGIESRNYQERKQELMRKGKAMKIAEERMWSKRMKKAKEVLPPEHPVAKGGWVGGELVGEITAWTLLDIGLLAKITPKLNTGIAEVNPKAYGQLREKMGRIYKGKMISEKELKIPKTKIITRQETMQEFIVTGKKAEGLAIGAGEAKFTVIKPKYLGRFGKKVKKTYDVDFVIGTTTEEIGPAMVVRESGVQIKGVGEKLPTLSSYRGTFIGKMKGKKPRVFTEVSEGKSLTFEMDRLVTEIAGKPTPKQYLQISKVGELGGEGLPSLTVITDVSKKVPTKVPKNPFSPFFEFTKTPTKGVREIHFPGENLYTPLGEKPYKWATEEAAKKIFDTEIKGAAPFIKSVKEGSITKTIARTRTEQVSKVIGSLGDVAETGVTQIVQKELFKETVGQTIPVVASGLSIQQILPITLNKFELGQLQEIESYGLTKLPKQLHDVELPPKIKQPGPTYVFEKERLRTIEKPTIKPVTSNIVVSKTIPKIKQLPMQKIIPAETQEKIFGELQLQIITPATTTRTVVDLILKDIPYIPPFEKGFVGLPPFPPLWLPTPKPEREVAITKPKKKKKVKKAYKPSLAALELGIVTTTSPKIITGVGIRPQIIKPKKKKLKKVLQLRFIKAKKRKKIKKVKKKKPTKKRKRRTKKKVKRGK